MRACIYVRSMMRVEESGQRTSQDDEDVPEAPPNLHPPSTSPDKTAILQNKPLSVELKEERIPYPSCDNRPTSDNTDMMGVSRGVEDARKVPRKLRGTSVQAQEHSKPMEEEYSSEGAQSDPNDLEDSADTSAAAWTFEDVVKRLKKLREASERISECSEDGSKKNSPSRPGEKPEGLSSETAIPDSVHGVQERPRRVGNEHVDEMNAPCRDRPPGVHRVRQVESRGVETESDRKRVVYRAECDGICFRSDGNVHSIKTNHQARRLNRRTGQVQSHQGRPGAPEQWRWRPERWKTRPDG